MKQAYRDHRYYLSTDTQTKCAIDNFFYRIMNSTYGDDQDDKQTLSMPVNQGKNKRK